MRFRVYYKLVNKLPVEATKFLALVGMFISYKPGDKGNNTNKTTKVTPLKPSDKGG